MSNLDTHPIIDENALSREIQLRLDQQRDESQQINVEKVWLEDGHWRAIVKLSQNGISAGQYANMLASVEEDLADSFGVNVLLIPASA